jgi:hypothetical protein
MSKTINMETVYWTMKNGQRISIDDMDVTHLRNTLKMIVKSIKVKPVSKPKFQVHGDIASEHADMAMLHSIDPALTCQCDEVHMCQQCVESDLN